MYENLTNPWVWDQDEFVVNQLGHPYQGSFYFIAGRANNLNFWESLVPTVLGSVTWEIFCETEKPSINDFIATTTGGAMMGEMLHRLYLEAYRKVTCASFLLSPLGEVNRLITGKPSAAVPERIEEFDFTIFAGSLLDIVIVKDEVAIQNKERIPVTVGAALNIIYGKPYGHETTIPLSHFEVNLKFDLTFDYYSFSLFSNGLLWSIAPPWNFLNADTTFGICI